MKLVLLSGIDSAVLGCHLLEEGNDIVFVHFNYGHAGNQGELKTIKYFKEFVREKFPKRKTLFKNFKLPTLLMDRETGYCPFRNMIFISYVLNYATMNNIEEVYYGAIEGCSKEAYADCTPSFVRYINDLIKYISIHEDIKLHVKALFINEDKDYIFKRAHFFGLNKDKFWHCNTPDSNGNSCGKCLDCLTFSADGERILRVLSNKDLFLKEKEDYFKKLLLEHPVSGLRVILDSDSNKKLFNNLVNLRDSINKLNLFYIYLYSSKINSEVLFKSINGFISFHFDIPIFLEFDMKKQEEFSSFKSLLEKKNHNVLNHMNKVKTIFNFYSQDIIFLVEFIDFLMKNNIKTTLSIYIRNISFFEKVLIYLKRNYVILCNYDFNIRLIPELDDFIKTTNEPFSYITYLFYKKITLKDFKLEGLKSFNAIQIIGTPSIEYILKNSFLKSSFLGEMYTQLLNLKLKGTNYISDENPYVFMIGNFIDDYISNYSYVNISFNFFDEEIYSSSALYRLIQNLRINYCDYSIKNKEEYSSLSICLNNLNMRYLNKGRD